MNTHALERTSPKGGPFIGKCRYCGAENLPMIAATHPCSKAPSQEVQLIDVLSARGGDSPMSEHAPATCGLWDAALASVSHTKDK